jgi:tetratricopeptide (TPR) repeat protein
MTGASGDGDGSSKLEEIIRLTMPGRLAIEMGDAKKAVSLLSKKHALILEVFGPASSSTGTSLIDLSAAYHIAGREKEARAMIEEAFSIYSRIDRRDQQLDRLEQTMMEICAMQGHSFEVERIAKARIVRLAEEGDKRDEERAVTQDELAQLYIHLGRNDEAIALLKNSLAIFQRIGGPSSKEITVCCLYLSRAFLKRPDFEASDHLEQTVTYGQKALESSKASEGPDSVAAAITADEVAVAIGFLARHKNSSEKAAEALTLSDWALSRFRALSGEGGKETLRSRENNYSLRKMLSTLQERASDDVQAAPDDAIALPTNIFVSHSYADRDALSALKAVLPDYVKTVVFEPITVPPSEYVSEKLISGVLGADGFVFIDSPVSQASFWTAFERDLAIRNDKQVFQFDSEVRRIVRYRVKPRQLFLAHLYHPSDAEDVTKVMRWLADERSFDAFDDPGRDGNQMLPFSRQEASKRDMFLFSIRSFGAVYLMFLSDALLQDAALRAHALEQVTQHPNSTLVCWLDRPRRAWSWDKAGRLARVPKDRSFKFTSRPTKPKFRFHELDDLMVRLYWLLHQGRPGDWFR